MTKLCGEGAARHVLPKGPSLSALSLSTTHALTPAIYARSQEKTVMFIFTLLEKIIPIHRLIFRLSTKYYLK